MAVARTLASPVGAAVLMVIAAGGAYLFDAGHGFIQDDFRWIRETRISSLSELPRLLSRSDGFYRPIVSASFMVNSWFGLDPRIYGLTNLALLVADAALLFLVARHLQLSAPAALLVTGVWVFNFHGINMAVLWISGRTSLIVTFGALLTALAVLSARRLLAGAACFVALLSKEEAVLFPLLFCMWLAYDAPGSWRSRVAAGLQRSWPMWAAFVVYLLTRLQTDAFWLADAPPYYRFSIDAVAANIVQYADRSMTCAAAAVIALLVAVGRPRLDHAERRIVIFSACWLLCGFALTLFVPARSSLYVVLPSIGPSLAAGAVASAALRRDPRRAGVVLATLTVLPVLLLPVYRARNERWVRLADVSTTVLEQLTSTAERTPARPLVLVDDASERFNLDAAFGSLWPDAAALFLGPNVPIEIVASEPASAHGSVLRLKGGRLVPGD